MVEHLEKSSPLLFEEIKRWRNYIWEDYLEYKSEETRKQELSTP
jgi:hypothetical protein